MSAIVAAIIGIIPLGAMFVSLWYMAYRWFKKIGRLDEFLSSNQPFPLTDYHLGKEFLEENPMAIVYALLVFLLTGLILNFFF